MSHPEQLPKDESLVYQLHAAEWDELKAEREAELRQANEQQIYDENRPYQDENGRVHAPGNDKFINPAEYHDEQRDIHYEESMGPAYEGMGVMELGSRLAKAQLEDDKTTVESISDLLLDKMAAHEGDATSSEDYNRHSGGKHSPDTNRPNAADHQTDPSEALWNRVMGYVDKERVRLTEEKLTEKRNRIDLEYAQAVIQSMKKDGVPDEIIKEIPSSYFYKKDDPELTFALPDSLRVWRAEHPEIIDATPDQVEDNDTNSQSDRNIVEGSGDGVGNEADVVGSDELRGELTDTKRRLAEIDEELAEIKKAKELNSKVDARLDAENEQARKLGNKVVTPGKWRDRIVFWKRKQQAADASQDKKYDLVMTRERYSKLLFGAVGALAVVTAGYAAYKGLADGDQVQAIKDLALPDIDLDKVAEAAPSSPVDASETVEVATGGTETTGAATDGAETVKAWTDTVASGDGITHTFIDYAQSKGHNLSSEQAYELFNMAKEQGLISEENISNISSQNVVGGTGYTNPGSTTLSPEIIEFLNSQIK